MNKEEFLQRVKQGKLGYADGAWFIMKQYTSVNKIKHYDPEQMCDVYEEQVSTNWLRDVNVPIDFVNEEWFQIEAIQRDPANIKHFDYLASDAVWKKLLDMGGKNLQYLTPQTSEMQAYAKDLSVENIGYFDSFTEEDVKELLMQDGIFIKAWDGAWSVYKKNRSGSAEKELCWLRLEDCIDTDFFYNKAMENDPYAADAIVKLAQKGEAKPYQFVLRHWSVPQFKNGIVELAKLKRKEALDIVFQNPNEREFLQCIVNMVRAGENVDARKFVFQNIDNATCWDCIVGLAEDGDEDAHNLVLNHLERPRSLEYVVKLVKNGTGDGRLLDAIYENAENVDCWRYILDLAKNRIPRAIETVCKYPEDAKGWSCILELARNRVPRAIDTVCYYPEHAGGWSCILELAQEGAGRATEVILKSQHLYLISCLAEHGNSDAVRLVLASKDLESVMKLAMKDNPDAVRFVLDSKDLESVMKLALKGNSEAKQIVLQSNNLDYITELAMKGESDAIKMVLQPPHHWEYIMKLALEKNSSAVLVVLRHGSSMNIAKLALKGISLAISQVLESDDYETIAQLAMNGDSRAVGKVFGNRECRSYISEWADAGDERAKQIMKACYRRWNRR